MTKGIIYQQKTAEEAPSGGRPGSHVKANSWLLHLWGRRESTGSTGGFPCHIWNAILSLPWGVALKCAKHIDQNGLWVFESSLCFSAFWPGTVVCFDSSPEASDCSNMKPNRPAKVAMLPPHCSSSSRTSTGTQWAETALPTHLSHWPVWWKKFPKCPNLHIWTLMQYAICILHIYEDENV